MNIHILKYARTTIVAHPRRTLLLAAPSPSHWISVEFVVLYACLSRRSTAVDVVVVVVVVLPLSHNDDVLSLEFGVIKFLGKIIIVIALL